MRDTHTGRRTPARGLGALLFVCGLLVLSAGAVWTSSAQASQPPHPVYYSQGVTIPNDGTTLSGPQQLAVNASDRTLLVANQGAGNVSVFSSSVDPGTGTTVMTAQPSIGAGVLSAPYGLAVDQALRRLYVSDPGTNVISRYTFTATTPAVYTADPTFTSPTLGAGTGQVGSFAASIAVDPTTHDLLVADQVNHRVSRYTAVGAFVRSFDGSAGVDGAFVSPLGVAVGADGSIYVADATSAVSDSGHLRHFSSADAPLADLTVATANAVGVGGSLGMLAVSGFQNSSFSPFLATFLGDTPTQTLAQFDSAFFDAPSGVAVDDGPGGNLYFSSGSGVSVFAPDPVLAPGVTAAAPSSVTRTTAHLSGSVNAGDATATASTSVHFEYYTSDATQPTLLPDLVLAGSGPNAVAADLTALRPNTTYHVRLRASRIDDALADPNTGQPYAQTSSPVLTITTLAAPPAVVEPPVTDATNTTATLPGSVDPFGLQSSYHFEYGTTDAYSSRSPVGADAVLGTPAAPKSVNASLRGLSPSTTYHYRLVATNTSGTTFGPDRQFTTQPTPVASDARGYEQVTPIDKGGADMNPHSGMSIQADGSAFDGSRVGFATRGSLPGSDVGTGLNIQYVGIRGTNGWSDAQLEVAVTTQSTFVALVSSVLSGQSLAQHPADLTHTVVYSDLVLAPGAVFGNGNLYREDNATRTLTLLASLPSSTVAELSLGSLPAFATPDTRHVYVLLDDHELYEAHDSQLTLISKTPTGDPLDFTNTPLSDIGNAYASTARTAGSVSTPDGGAVVYASPTEGAFINRAGQVTPISVSERAGDPPTPQPISAATFTEDGTAVLMQNASGVPLTDDGTGGGIYRYTLSAPAGHRLTYIGDSGGITSTPVIASTRDGQTVVFGSPTGLMAYRNGRREMLSPAFGSTPDSSPQISLSLSPNGRYFAVTKGEALTDSSIVNADTCGPSAANPGRDGGCAEVYLFDLDAGTVVCASCAADGSPPAGDAQMGQLENPSVDDGGEVFFDTKTKLVSADGNADSDVYAYQAGRVRLISRGTRGTHSVFSGASSSGSDVFFFTDDQLVTQDTDSAIDLYDARQGGGFRAQNPVADERGPCAGSECQEPRAPAGVTSGPSAPSESVLTASETPPPTPLRATATVSRAIVSATAIRLTIRASARGDVRISGHYLTTLKRSLAAPGSYTVKVSLSHAAQRLHRAHRRLSVGVRVSLTPPFGAVAVTTLSRTLRG